MPKFQLFFLQPSCSWCLGTKEAALSWSVFLSIVYTRNSQRGALQVLLDCNSHQSQPMWSIVFLKQRKAVLFLFPFSREKEHLEGCVPDVKGSRFPERDQLLSALSHLLKDACASKNVQDEKVDRLTKVCDAIKRF